MVSVIKLQEPLRNIARELSKCFMKTKTSIARFMRRIISIRYHRLPKLSIMMKLRSDFIKNFGSKSDNRESKVIFNCGSALSHCI